MSDGEREDYRRAIVQGAPIPPGQAERFYKWATQQLAAAQERVAALEAENAALRQELEKCRER